MQCVQSKYCRLVVPVQLHSTMSEEPRDWGVLPILP